MNLQALDVHIQELNVFPNTVVEVATEVPAFIGYTRNTVDALGALLINKPRRITSMAEYEQMFGGAPESVFSLQAVVRGAGAAPVSDVSAARGQQAVFNFGDQNCLLTRADGKAGGRYLMHLGMRHFFENGGGGCCVVSVGGFGDEIAVGDQEQGLIGGIAALINAPEPTLLVVPDAV